MNVALRVLLIWTIAAVLTAAVWMVIASCVFIALCGFWGHPQLPLSDYLWGWAIRLPYAAGNFTAILYLTASALVATVPLLGFLALFARRWWRRQGGFRGLKHQMGIGRIERARSKNYGDADWMDDDRIAKLFPPYPHPKIGGIVVGERSRDDLAPEHALPFDPTDRNTWGKQGKAPLMFDHCKRGTTHSLIIGGGGAYKSTTLTPTLLHWKCSSVILDPSGELYDKLADALKEDGKEVIKLDIGIMGPNVLEAIDLKTQEGRKLADVRIQSVVARVIGPMPKDETGNAGRFKRWGRSIIMALLAHLVYSEDVPADLKTLRTVRRGLESKGIKDILRGIEETSPSSLARSQASNALSIADAEETWSGAFGNAMDDTEWLGNDSYADLVCGNAFNMKNLARGNLAVFCQIKQEVLQVTPALARALIGGLLDAVFSAEGRVKGRVGFFLDEAVLIGAEPSLKLARDQGRKYKITMQLFYQSEGQIEDVWGKSQKDTWFDGVSFRSYTRIQSLSTAKDISATAGTYGAIEEKRGSNTGTSGRPLEWSSRSQGSNISDGEVARELAKPHELLQEVRANERITFIANDRPIRHLSAIDFCRDEIDKRLNKTNYQTEFDDEDLREEAA